MNVHHPTESFDKHRPDDEVTGAGEGAVTADILIGRMVDHEASPDDSKRFERLAQGDPELWKSLALKQRDMMLLANKLDEQTRFADRIDLPAGGAGSILNVRWPWLAVLSGWAAVVVLAVVWNANVGKTSERIDAPSGQLAVAPAQAEMTADDYFAAYVKTGRETGQVINLMPSALVETTNLPDGRMNLRIIRRIEENLVVDRAPELDDRGNLKSDPAELRERSPAGSSASPPQ